MCVGTSRNANPHTHVHLIASSIAANQQKRLSVCHRDDRSSLSAETDRRLPRGAHTRKHARRCVTAACGLFSVIGAGVNRVKTTKWQMTGGEKNKTRELLEDEAGSRGPQIRPDPTDPVASSTKKDFSFVFSRELDTESVRVIHQYGFHGRCKRCSLTETGSLHSGFQHHYFIRFLSPAAKNLKIDHPSPKPQRSGTVKIFPPYLFI